MAAEDRLDAEVPIQDSVTLTTVDGGELLLQDAALKMSEVSEARVRPGAVDCTWSGALGILLRHPLMQGLQVRSAGDSLVEDVRRSLASGVLSAMRREPLRFRVGAEDPVERAARIELLEQEFGWVNSTSDWDVNVQVTGDRVGIDVGPLHWNDRYVTLARQGFSTPTAVATVLARISRLREGDVVLDPFCGAATNLVASAVTAADLTLLGIDINADALALGEANLDRLRTVSPYRSARLEHASADALPFEDSSVDRVVSNLPFGKLVGSHEGNVQLYPKSLREIARVLRPDGKVTLLTEDKRLFEDSVARTRGLKIVSDRVLRYGGATPTAYSIRRSRR